MGRKVQDNQKQMEQRQQALDDRRAKLAKKPKPELEEQVRGAEMLLKEASAQMESSMREFAIREVHFCSFSGFNFFHYRRHS